jgi:hypothetical protein
MMRALYFFNWNITDSAVKENQESNYQKLLEIWRKDTEKVFSTAESCVDALMFTHKTLSNNLILEGFITFRAFVKIASQIIFLSVIAPRIAEKISNWGEVKDESWSLALFCEDIING